MQTKLQVLKYDRSTWLQLFINCMFVPLPLFNDDLIDKLSESSPL